MGDLISLPMYQRDSEAIAIIINSIYSTCHPNEKIIDNMENRDINADLGIPESTIIAETVGIAHTDDKDVSMVMKALKHGQS